MKALLSDSQQRVAVRPWSACKLGELSDLGGEYDAILATVGYEPRSHAIVDALASQLPPTRVAVGFKENQTSDYYDSHERFKQLGFKPSEDYDEKFVPRVRELFLGLTADHPRVLIDISSMSRPRIAGVVQALAEMPADSRLAVDFLYAPARFRQPGDLPTGVLTLVPVTSYFMGRMRRRSQLIGLVGLGYEPYKAAGALESLEVREAIAYVPEGRERRFKPSVLKANRGLLHSHERPELREYRVDDPFDLFTMLDGQIQALLLDGKVPTMVPLGPKVFALCSCLAAAAHYPDVSVWRASFEQKEPAIPHKADGWVCGVSVTRRPAMD